MTTNFRNLEKVCLAMGLILKRTKKGCIYVGIINGSPARIPIHVHAEGRDVPNGLLKKYCKDLGFSTTDEYFAFLKKHLR